MKLVYIIVHDVDGEFLTEELNQADFSVTKLATTGGFLKKGNTTLLVGTDDDKVEQVIDIVKEKCGSRQRIQHNAPYPMSGAPGMFPQGSVPVSVEVGGATIFVTNVEQFVKI